MPSCFKILPFLIWFKPHLEFQMAEQCKLWLCFQKSDNIGVQGHPVACIFSCFMDHKSFQALGSLRACLVKRTSNVGRSVFVLKQYSESGWFFQAHGNSFCFSIYSILSKKLLRLFELFCLCWSGDWEVSLALGVFQTRWFEDLWFILQDLRKLVCSVCSIKQLLK